MWNVAANNPSGAFTSQAYGPYSGWAAAGLAINDDGDSKVIWNSTSDEMSFWDIGSTWAFTSQAYGPYSGWQAIGVAPGP